MGFFTIGKKKNCCGGGCPQEATDMSSAVKVLGGDCAKCKQLENATVEALKELGMETTIEHVTDFAQIATFGVMTTPALVVDGKVVSYGKILRKNEVIKILEKVRKV